MISQKTKGKPMTFKFLQNVSCSGVKYQAGQVVDGKAIAEHVESCLRLAVIESVTVEAEPKETKAEPKKK